MSRFLTLSYWFSNSKPIAIWTLNILAWIFVFFIALSVFVRYVSSKREYKDYKKLLLRISHLLLTFGIIGEVLVFFSSQRIPYFGLRFYYPILAITGIVWGLSILKYWYNKLPLELNERQRQEALKKYLPRKG